MARSKKKPEPSIWRLRLEPYPVDLVFVTCRDQAREVIEEEFDDDDCDVSTCAGITYGHGSQILMAVFTDDEVPGEQLCTLHHECIHAAMHTLELVGIDSRSNSGECLTYLSESIFRAFKDIVTAA